MDWESFSEGKLHVALFEISDTNRNFGILRHEVTRRSFLQSLERAIKTVTSESIPLLCYATAHAPFQKAKEHRDVSFDCHHLLLQTGLFEEAEEDRKLTPKNGGGVLVLVHESQKQLRNAASVASQALKRIPADVYIT